MNPDITTNHPSEHINTTNHTCDNNKTFDQLIIDNEKFVYSIVNKEFKQYPWSIKEELYSAGKAGLVYAATKFDTSKFDNKFISYAVHWIRYYVNEEIRNMYPVKLNQNYVYKRKLVKTCINKFKKKYNRIPTVSELSSLLNMSEKVINNILNINNGENFKFISFQSLTTENTNKTSDDDYIENKLVNEFFEQSDTAYELDKFELDDLLDALKKNVNEKDYNMFVDKYIHGLSYSDLAKKYKLNFPSYSKYIIKKKKKVCKELLTH